MLCLSISKYICTFVWWLLYFLASELLYVINKVNFCTGCWNGFQVISDYCLSVFQMVIRSEKEMLRNLLILLWFTQTIFEGGHLRSAYLLDVPLHVPQLSLPLLALSIEAVQPLSRLLHPAWPSGLHTAMQLHGNCVCQPDTFCFPNS